MFAVVATASVVVDVTSSRSFLSSKLVTLQGRFGSGAEVLGGVHHWVVVVALGRESRVPLMTLFEHAPREAARSLKRRCGAHTARRSELDDLSFAAHLTKQEGPEADHFHIVIDVLDSYELVRELLCDGDTGAKSA